MTLFADTSVWSLALRRDAAPPSVSALAESRRKTLMFFRHYRRPEMYRRWDDEIR